jgi:flagellar L-ring protein precursor FlgH
MKKFIGVLTSMSLLLLGGCEVLNPPAPGKDINYAPTYPTTPDPKELHKVNGAIYNSETAVSLYETSRARRVGDILTVVLVENTNATQNAKTTQTKNDQEMMANPVFLGRPISLGGGYSMDMSLSNNRAFTGEGKTTQYNQLAGKLSVTVAKVFSNGNLMVQGEKWVRVGQAKEYVQVSGIVRPRDIGTDNAISSDRIANARISYGGVGQIDATNAQGWFSRFIWGPLAPT